MSLAFVAGTACVAEETLETSETESNLSVWSWSDDAQIPNQSSARQVGLAWFGDQLFMVHNGSSTPSELWWSKRDESNKQWLTNARIPSQRAEGGPALVVHQNQLRMIYRVATQNKLAMSTFNPANGAWSFPVDAGTTVGTNRRVDSAPSAVVVNDRLHVAYCERENGKDRVRVEVLDGQQWRSTATFEEFSFSPCRHVALGSAGNRLHLVWTTTYPDSVGQDLWFMSGADADAATATPTWGAKYNLAFKSTKPPSLTTCGGNVHMVHGGFSSPNEIWWTYRVGNTWAADARIPNQASHGGAALVCANGRTTMVHNGGNDQLWFAEFE